MKKICIALDTSPSVEKMKDIPLSEPVLTTMANDFSGSEITSDKMKMKSHHEGKEKAPYKVWSRLTVL